VWQKKEITYAPPLTALTARLKEEKKKTTRGRIWADLGGFEEKIKKKKLGPLSPPPPRR
jgi:hypothetical protein